MQIGTFWLTFVHIKKSWFFSSDTAEYATEHGNDANLGIFSELVPNTVQIEDSIYIDDNFLIKDNTIRLSVMPNCNVDDLSEDEAHEYEEYDSINYQTYEQVWKTINN